MLRRLGWRAAGWAIGVALVAITAASAWAQAPGRSVSPVPVRTLLHGSLPGLDLMTSVDVAKRRHERHRAPVKKAKSRTSHKIVEPKAVVPPAVTGTPVVGATLVTSAGVWSGQPSTYSYGWVDCNAAGSACAWILGANSRRYTLRNSDAGHTVRSVVAAGKSSPTGTRYYFAASAPTEPVTSVSAPSVPVVSQFPAISGTAQQGDTMSASTGTWSGDPTSYRYAWEQCATGGCLAIPGASTTSGSYTLQASAVGDTIEVAVTAVNQYGASASATSAPTHVVLPALLVNVTPPAITGTAQVGDTLTSSTGTWSGSAASYSYVWEDCTTLGSCTAIPSTSTTSGGYTLRASDLGDTIEVAVTATNAGGQSAPATSVPTAAVVAAPVPVPVKSVAPSITGTAQVGDTLTSSTGTWSGSPSSYSYAWKDCSAGTCTTISGASTTSGSYLVASGDVGDTIEVAVTARNAGGQSAPATSAPTAVVTSSSGGAGALNGIKVVGNQLETGSGTPVVLHGVDRSGTEYACSEGWGITDGPNAESTNPTEFGPMKSWDINSVMIALNEDCWLGVNGTGIANWTADSGTNYINEIKAEVAEAESDGIYPVISFLWGDPGTEVSSGSDPNGGGQPALPDNAHAPLLWEEVAETFKNDPNVIFRLQEEPHPSATGPSGAGANTDGSGGYALYNWQCWAHGSVPYSTSSASTTFGVAPTPSGAATSACEEYATDGNTLYQTVGMQSLVNIIRGTGANNVIQVPGLDYANMTACSPTGNPVSCGVLDSADGVKLTDPTTSPNGPQLMTDLDMYPDSSQTCSTTTCYNDTIGPVASVMPVDLGEIGSINGVDTQANVLLNWMDAEHQSYYAWAWDTWAPLITSYSGGQTSPFGVSYYDRLTG